MKIALYCRVSTAEQAEHGHSIGEQAERLKNYCKSRGWKNYQVYTDAGFSGAKLDRPALQSLIADVKNHKVGIVLVYKLDRLSRSQKDTLMLIEDVILSNNCDFISISENFDTSTPLGRAMIGILAVFAQLEREQIQERMTMGKEARAKQGKFRGGGLVPIGYEYTDGKLIVNEYEAMQIREIHSLYQKGYSFKAIARTFAQKGYSHKYGEWNEHRIKRVLVNKVYIGKIHYKGEYFDGEHEPIIDEETFNRSVAIWESHDYSLNNNGGKTSYLSGLIWCKQCSARYGLATSRWKGKHYHYYRCYSQRKTNRGMIRDENCKNVSYKMKELDQIIFDEIGKLALDPSYIRKIEPQKDDTSKKIKLLQKQIDKLDAQRSRFMDLYGLGTFTVDDIQEKIEPLNEQRMKLEQEIKTLQDSKPLSEEDAIKMLSNWDDVLGSGDFDLIKSLLNTLIERIDLDGDDIYIHWRFS